jgi:hypothetical protein
VLAHVRDQARDRRLTFPCAYALRVVESSLQHRCTGEGRKRCSSADVVGMEVCDDNPRDLQSVRSQYGLPAPTRVGKPEPGVDDRPRAVVAPQRVAVDVVDSERKRERDPNDAVVELDDVVSASSRRRPSRL